MPDDETPPQRFLGKRDPINKPTLQVGEFLTAQALPEHPPVSPPPNVTWPMDRNDQAGDCVVAGVDHTLQAIAANLGLPRRNWTDAELLELYRTQNPDFLDWNQGGSDADQGMVIQTFLEECIRRGFISAFARIDHEDSNLMRAATYIGGGIVTGEVLRQVHASQDPWDASKSPIWGGHCTTTVGYDENLQRCITWGGVQGYTEAFAERHMDEAWFILTPALINNPSFRNNFDMHGFSSAVADLTNGKIIVPVPDPVPTPPPVAPPVDPGPPTPPDPAWADFPFHEMDAWANHKPKTDEAYNRNAKDAYRRWKAEHRVDQRNASTRRMVYDEAGRPVGMVDLAGSFWASQS